MTAATQAISATMTEKTAPMMPALRALRARRKAMKVNPQAIGNRTKAFEGFLYTSVVEFEA